MRIETYYRLLSIADVVKTLGEVTTRDLVDRVPCLTIHNANKILQRHPAWFERKGETAAGKPLWRLTREGKRRSSGRQRSLFEELALSD